MSKRKESYYLGKGSQGWWSGDDKYHIGGRKAVLKKLYPEMYQGQGKGLNTSTTETIKRKGDKDGRTN